jgi:DNA-binding transcriptional LysR family regulator
LAEHNCIQNILNDHYDLACTVAPLERDKVDYIPIKSEEILLTVHYDNPLSQKDKINFTDLKNEEIISYDRMTIGHNFEKFCARAGFKPNIIYRSDVADILINMVNLNKGISFCPKHITDNINRPDVRFIPFKDKRFKWEFGILYKKNKRLNQATKLFMDYLLNHYNDYKYP